MRRIKIYLLLCVFVMILCLIHTNIYAALNTNNLSLHQMTKIYSKAYSSDYYSGCEDNSKYKNQMPEITVLTHGFGSSGWFWSNDINARDKDGNFILTNNESSLISKINNELNGNVNIYYVQCKTDFSYNITKYNGKLQKSKEVARIDDVSKHIILVYESAMPFESNENVYVEFENMLDTISLQYKSMTGYLPKFNLVGHSRGGITNIKYATDHPYNVSSLISLGTPYNGSVLGNVEFILDLLGYKRDNGTPNDKNDDYYDAGIVSILDYNESVKIRDSWNAVLNDDVNINAIAYGSITSVNYLDDFIKDASNLEEYSFTSGYVDLVEFIVALVEKCPDATNYLLNFIDGMAEFVETANYFYENIHNTLYDYGLVDNYQEHQNMYDVILGNINEEYVGSITTEEGSKILDLYSIINGEPVILDDLFIDLASQLGTGFIDGINYANFKRYIKIFEAEDITDNRSIPDQPAVVHNMETMNNTYTDKIANLLSYGTRSASLEEVKEDASMIYDFIGEKTFIINSGISVNRTIKVSVGVLSIYKITDDNVIKLCNAVNEYTDRFSGTYSYLIVISKNSLSNATTMTATCNDVLTNSISLEGKESLLVKYSSGSNGYKIFNLGNENVIASKYSNLGSETSINYSSNGNYYFYVKSNSITYIKLTNSSSTSQKINVSFIEPTVMKLEDEEKTLNSNNKIMVFENPFSYSVTYQLKISSDNGILFYDSNNSTITSTHSKNIYTITLKANEKIYIFFGNTLGTFDMIINRSQMKVCINGVETTSGVELTRGKSYSVRLYIKDSNGKLHYEICDFITLSSNYYTFIDGTLNIYSNAIVGNEIAIVPTIAPELTFGVKVGYNNKIGMFVNNSDNITTQFVNYDNDYIANINYSIIKNETETSYNLSLSANASITKYLTSIIGNTIGNSIIKLNYIQLYRIGDGPIIYNGSTGLNVSSVTINNMFYSGAGTSSSPYVITCYRHLNNIRNYSSYYYRLGNSIDLSGKGNWTPFSFYGNFNGNGYTISNMRLYVYNNSNYGFVSSNYGNFFNLRFINTIITKQDSLTKSNPWIGVFAGVNYGSIDSCKAINTTADIRLSTSYLGVLVGYNSNYGKIINSYSDYSRISGSGSVGGLVGYNTGKILSANVYDCHITYYYTDTNGNIGLACGYNSGRVECEYIGGMLYWNNSDQNSSILPSIGRIIGLNASSGTYSVSSTNIGWDLVWQIKRTLWWTDYDQGGRIFKFDDRNVGWQE